MRILGVLLALARLCSQVSAALGLALLAAVLRKYSLDLLRAVVADLALITLFHRVTSLQGNKNTCLSGGFEHIRIVSDDHVQPICQ